MSTETQRMLVCAVERVDKGVVLEQLPQLVVVHDAIELPGSSLALQNTLANLAHDTAPFDVATGEFVVVDGQRVGRTITKGAVGLYALHRRTVDRVFALGHAEANNVDKTPYEPFVRGRDVDAGTVTLRAMQLLERQRSTPEWRVEAAFNFTKGRK